MRNAIWRTETHEEYAAGDWYVDVTDIAKGLFGDVIERAEQIVNHEDKLTNYVRRLTVEIDHDTALLNLRYGEVVLYFVNGKRVVINSSEWGKIQSYEVQR